MAPQNAKWRKKPSIPRLPSIFEDDNEQKKFTAFKNQDFYELRHECLQSNKLFEDPEFMPSNEILFYDIHTPAPYKWLRPQEICDDPKFVIDTYSRFSAKQGGLGDCWLVSAITTLTLHQKFLHRVICADNSFDDEVYAGIFHFRFWHFGEWVDVVIDDRLPTHEKQLVYLHSKNKNELWSALLEKAYAKLHGGYQFLDGGESCKAFQSFTGGISESYNLEEAPNKIINKLKTNLRKSSMQDVGTGIMIGCGINNREGSSEDEENEDDELENQLPSEHAYSITRLACVNNTQLLRLRNPYGNRVKWKGAWSDDSKEWDTVPEDVKRRMSLRRTSDGEFWMSYEDFVKRFNVIEVCNFSPGDAIEDTTAQHDGKWHKITEKGEWIAGMNSGGFKNVEINPQYLMTLESSSNSDNEFSIVVTLMQNSEELAISFYIYHIAEEFMAVKAMGGEFFEKSKREAKTKVSFAMDVHCSYKLLPGKYLIVPFNRKCESGEFLLRLFADKKCALTPLGNLPSRDNNANIFNKDP